VSDPSKELVHARYLGDTPVVMKHLGGGAERCCIKENQRGENVHDEESGELVSGPALVCKGDVILLDRYSAEGREDFEIAGDQDQDQPSKRGKGKAAPQSEKE